MIVSRETRETLEWILTEIGAGMVLFPRSDAERTWNDAHERCKQIIANYKEGIGLFQITNRKDRP